jgi:hypothetical protein
MGKFLIRFMPRWLLTYEEKSGYASGSFWMRRTRLYWFRELAERRATILILSPGFEKVEIHDTRSMPDGKA